MDRAMLDAFREQTLIGNKAKGGQAGWKAPAFIAVIKHVQPLCRQTLSKDHVQNRLKTMRRMMKNVKELVNLSGFGWSVEKKMVMAEEPVRNELLEARPKMKYLKNKPIDLYLEMVEVLGDEPAVGNKETTTTLMAEDESATNEHTHPFHGVDANSESYGVGGYNAASEEELGQSSSSGKRKDDIPHSPRKRNRSLASSLAQEMSGIKFEIGRIATAMSERNDSCWDAVKVALDELELETDCKLQCMEWFFPDVEKRKFFLSLNVEERKRWLMMKLSRNN